jgi:predicted RNase H-like HicB family nuclease
LKTAFGYRYVLERQENGWWLVRFPEVPEALTDGETKEEVRANALDCLVAALEGCMKQGRPLPPVLSSPPRTETAQPGADAVPQLRALNDD